MDKKDWYDAGEEIKNLVQDAVDRQDFSQLSSTIANVVNQTMDGFQSALKDSLGGKNTAGVGGGYDTRKSYHEASDRIKREMENKKRYRQAESVRTGEQTGRDVEKKSFHAAKPAKYKKLKAPGQVSGMVMASVGYSFAAMFGLSLGILGTVGLTLGGFGISTACGIVGILFGASLGMGIGGSKKLGRASRFRRYMGLLKERTYCSIEELASGTGKSIQYVQKDLKRMIQKGFFPEGHMDRQETCLITDHETYQQYLLTQKEYDRRAEEQKDHQTSHQNEENDSDSKVSRENLSQECRAILEEGNRYIRHIHECNDRIPGEEISAKLDRLELVVTRIFREVERRPELAPELRKMMSYYLPTTQKLLDAYCELDAQVIQGQNIDTTKREIEDSLDTINQAFENLLDGFFENTAWDISSDISVLHTMFAQEGLTGKKDFTA